MKSNNFSRNIALSLIFFVVILPGCSPEEAILYVAPDGSDLNEGSIRHPFASITKARDVIREYKSQGKKGPYSVKLREGTYYLPATFLLTPEDSGKDGEPVLYTNHNN